MYVSAVKLPNATGIVPEINVKPNCTNQIDKTIPVRPIFRKLIDTGL